MSETQSEIVQPGEAAQPQLIVQQAAIASAVSNGATVQPGVPEIKVNEFSDRHFFAPADAAKATEMVNRAQQTPLYVLTYKAPDGQEPWPKGAGCAVLPIAKRVEVVGGGKETKQYGLIAWPVWSMASLIGDVGIASMTEEARNYLAGLAEADQAARILNPLRKQEVEKGGDQLDLSGLPRTMQDHLEGVQTSHGMLKAYNELAGAFLKKIKQMAPVFKHFTPAIMRQYMQSSRIATDYNSELEASGFWVTLIERFKVEAIKAGLSVDVFDQWLETRDRDDEDETVDLGALDISSLSL